MSVRGEVNHATDTTHCDSLGALYFRAFVRPGMVFGVTAGYIKPGDSAKARCHHLRDGSNGCLLGFLKVKDGTVKDWDGNNAPAPADF